MIEQPLYEHLVSQEALAPYLTTYNKLPAVFSQEAPSDEDPLWGPGPQYSRIVFAVDLDGDPERIMGGMLAVDIMCVKGGPTPEEIEPIIRSLIHGYFLSGGTFTVAAQWKNSSYFTEPTDEVIGCTVTFDLLGFPVLSPIEPDVVDRLNEWSAAFEGLHVINHDPLPRAAWIPTDDASAIYWRVVSDDPAGWIPDTFQTIWRKATIRGHIFSKDNATAAIVARNLITRLYALKRLKRDGEAPIMVNQKNAADYGSDPLRTGQLTVEATYGVIVHYEPDKDLLNINFK